MHRAGLQHYSILEELLATNPILIIHTPIRHLQSQILLLAAKTQISLNHVMDSKSLKILARIYYLTFLKSSQWSSGQ